MGLPNLSGSNIQDTYQRVLHTDGTIIYNGTGSVFLPVSSSYAVTASYAVSSSHAVNADSASYVENLSGTNTGDQNLEPYVLSSTTASFAITGSNVTFTDITSSGAISSSGIITAVSFIGNMDGGSF